MRKIALSLLAVATVVLCVAACTSSDEAAATTSAEPERVLAGTATISGDVSGVYDSGTFVVYKPRPKVVAPSSGATSMKTAAPAMTSAAPAMTSASSNSDEPEQTALVRLKAAQDVLGHATVVDGKFLLDLEVEEPTIVYYYVIDALSKDGRRFAPTKGSSFILEPAELAVQHNKTLGFFVTGGYFNSVVFNSWRLHDDHIAIREEMDRVRPLAYGSDEDTSERRAYRDEYGELSNQSLDFEVAGRDSVIRTHPDYLVRKLTYQSSWLRKADTLDQLTAMAELNQDDPWLVAEIEHAKERRATLQEQRKIDIGTKILDFEAESLEGATVELADIREDSKYVLVEFWASWCGPCIVEIPHMKQAYEKYHERGFDIVSFTIDEEREDWEDASIDHQLPWHNLGMGIEADAAQSYHVTGVPMNFLVASADGEILAKNVRQHVLDEKLAELFDE